MRELSKTGKGFEPHMDFWRGGGEKEMLTSRARRSCKKCSSLLSGDMKERKEGRKIRTFCNGHKVGISV